MQPLEDAALLTKQLFRLIATPFRAIKGFHDYHTQNMSKLRYGVLSSFLCVSLVALAARTQIGQSSVSTTRLFFNEKMVQLRDMLP